MEIWTLLGVVSALAFVASYDERLHGIEIPTKHDNTTVICDRNGAFCDNDCETLMVCIANNPTPLARVACAGSNPFCVNNACRAVPEPSCPNAPPFICTEDGIFPEYNNCRRYRVCEGGKSRVYECIAGFVFNSNTRLCQPGNTPCGTINCANSNPNNPYIVYANNPAFYAVCLNNGNGFIQTVMFKCPYDQFEVFDTNTNSCRFSCLSRRGVHQNPANCNQYYNCAAALATTLPTLLSCPTNHVFDGVTCNPDPATCRFPPRSFSQDAVISIDSILP